MNEKAIGYFLLILGLGAMIGSLINVVMVFTKRAKPVSVIELSANPAPAVPQLPLSIPTPIPGQPGLATQPDLSALQNMLTQQTSNLFSPAALNQSINLSLHIFLMGFIASIGYKIAMLGTQLIRPIVVKSREVHEVSAANDPSKLPPSPVSPQYSSPTS